MFHYDEHACIKQHILRTNSTFIMLCSHHAGDNVLFIVKTFFIHSFVCHTVVANDERSGNTDCVKY